MNWHRWIWDTILLSFLSFVPAQAQSPSGWHLAGDNPGAYLVSTRLDEERDGTVAVLSRRDRSSAGFGTMMQTIQANDYRGHRVILTASVQAVDVEGWSGLWMRIDAAEGDPRTLGFDNMQDRPIRGTKEWSQHSIMLDVPANAARIAFGVLLEGAGTVAVDDFTLTKVGMATEPTHPVNLDFEP